MLYYVVGFLLLIVPLILTIMNIINLLKKKKIREGIFDILTFTLGPIFTIVLYYMSEFKDYQEALRLGGMDITVHNPIASWSIPTVFTILVVGIFSYCFIRIKKMDLPPLIIVLSISGTVICSIYMIMFLIQVSTEKLFNNIFNGLPYLMLFPINYILCSIRAIIEIMQKYKEKNLKPKEYNNKFLNWCSKTIYDIDKWPIIGIILSIPLSIILICVLVLFGQRPDEAIRAFLETSDWNLSQKISPPPIEYDGHYLCTVALKGHKNLVKPTRMGIRRGERIVVNRQLCIANAFEDLIQEKAPRFHHFIRYIYDKYGFPLAKIIKTSLQADIIYIMMKPLKWIFLITLYLFDKSPENRISTQYIGKAKF